MKCQKCGFENEEGANFCGNCGQKLIVISSDDLICPHCGTKNEKGAQFCYQCGGALVKRVEESTTKDTPVHEELEENEFIIHGTVDIPQKEETVKKEAPKKVAKSAPIKQTPIQEEVEDNEAPKFNSKMIIIGIICLLLLVGGGIGFAAYKGYITNPFHKEANEYATLISEADKLYEEGSLDEAISKYKEAIEADPTQADPYIKIAQIDMTNYDYNEACEILTEGIEAIGNDNEALNSEVDSVYSQALAYAKEDVDYDNRMNTLDLLCKLKPSQIDAYEEKVTTELGFVTDDMDYSKVDSILDNAKNYLTTQEYNYLYQLRENDRLTKENDAANKAAAEAKAKQEEAEEKANSQEDEEDYYDGYKIGEYYVNETMNIRTSPSKEADTDGTIEENETVYFIEIVSDTSGNIWGKIDDAMYVCIKEGNNEWCTPK